MKRSLCVGFALFIYNACAAVAAPAMAITVIDRVQYEAISFPYCADVARAANAGRSKKLGHYDVIDVISAGIDQNTGISEVMRKNAKRMVTVLVTRIYQDKISAPEMLEGLSRVECIWANQTLQGMEVLAKIKQ